MDTHSEHATFALKIQSHILVHSQSVQMKKPVNALQQYSMTVEGQIRSICLEIRDHQSSLCEILQKTKDHHRSQGMGHIHQDAAHRITDVIPIQSRS